MNIAAKIADKVLGQVATETPTQPNLEHPMHALCWDGKKKIAYEEKPRPMITDPRDIILKITATTICGSDLHLYSGNMADMHQGDILGHEFMGIVDVVGAQVKNLTKGQRVVVAFDIACGSCEFCARHEYTACSVTNPSKLMEKVYGHRCAALYGYSHLTGGVPGGQAEYVRVPFADFNCLPIPDDVSDEKALYLSDVVPTAFHGTELGSVQEGSIVGIWGLGPIGLMTARWCQIKGAGRVFGIDSVPERLDMAKKLGIEPINFSQVDVLKTIFERVPGGLDVAIECAGFEYAKTFLHKFERAVGLETDTADILSECITATRCFGTVSIIGVYSGYCNHFPIGAVMEKDLIIKCGQSPTQKYWKMALDKIRSGELDPTFIITHRGSLSDGPRLYEQFFNRDGGIIKVFLRP